MLKKINIRPTSGVYATYKRLSYQPWTAIAEFVDNSTQSFYDHKDELLALHSFKGLSITVNYHSDDADGDRLEIYDNAFGMEWPDFQRAVVLDRPPRDTSGRNEFGMGLKTAACWFGSQWSVESTQFGSKNKYYTKINVDDLGKHNIEEIDVKEEVASATEHYTRIVIKHLHKRIVGSRTIGKVKELLSSIYREDIRSGLVRIFYNGTLLQFKEPPVYEEIIGKEPIKWKKDISFSIEHEGKQLPVYGFIALRLPGSVKDAGFTLIRRGRVIVGGSDGNYRPSELFGDSNSYTWQRLYGELHMDAWPVTQAKDNFDWHNCGLEEAFISKLSTFTQDYRRKAETIRVREKIQSKDLVKNVTQGFSKFGAVEDVEVDIITEDKETHLSNSDSSFENAPSEPKESPIELKGTSEQDGVIVEGGKQIRSKFKYKGREYLFHILLDDTDPTIDWLLVEMVDSCEYTLSLNIRHPFFKPLIENKEFLGIMTRVSIAMALAEVESMLVSPDGKVEPSAIRLKMNDLLKVVGEGD